MKNTSLKNIVALMMLALLHNSNVHANLQQAQINAGTTFINETPDVNANISSSYNGALTSGIGNLTWLDVNRNGKRDNGERGVAGIIINLYLSIDVEKTNPIATTVSDENGQYSFLGLDADFDYVVEFIAEEVDDVLYFISTGIGTGVAQGIDNDNNANPTNGFTGVISLEPNEFNSTVDAGFTCASCPLELTLRLQGAINNTNPFLLMDDDLRQEGLIPFNDPYSSDPNFSGIESKIVSSNVLGVTGENAIIDWVLVDLRDPTNIFESRMAQPALLQRDGDVVDVDGVSPIGVNITGDFYVAIHHRNHLGVMTHTPIRIDGTDVVVDFTNINTQTYGQHAQANLGTHKALWCGNVTKNETVIFQGDHNDPNEIFFDILTDPNNTTQQLNYIKSGYESSDVDMNCNIIFQGEGNDVNEIFFTVLSHPENTTLSPNYIVREQIP